MVNSDSTTGSNGMKYFFHGPYCRQSQPQPNPMQPEVHPGRGAEVVAVHHHSVDDKQGNNFVKIVTHAIFSCFGPGPKSSVNLPDTS
jgi:hypothetical protein